MTHDMTARDARDTTIEEDLRRYVALDVLGETTSDAVRVDEPLLSTGRIDSLGLLQVLAYIDQRYGVALLQTSSPKEFESVASLAAAIRRTGHHG